MLTTLAFKELILGNFNIGIEEPHMKSFWKITTSQVSGKNKENPDSPTCIDLILSNVPRSFQSTCAMETVLSDFHLITLTVM